MAQRQARVAHNHEVTGSKPVAGISLYRVHRSVLTFPRQNRLSSSAERTAHNREVTGSTPVGGTSLYRVHRSVLTSKTTKTNQPAWRRGSAQGS